MCCIYFKYTNFKETFVGSFEDLTIIYNTVSKMYAEKPETQTNSQTLGP